ncbi:kelch domain-containing protein 4 [Phtheirospermum japonicum]|uniref:Kelch domain-containing protein 4 n=1 Tax=Phtheirospermum japonicum TaxID=374723 RepID=A0A830BGX1_9LAMI|nr:kelch domain-containing protein 4 [Phtheirospermum japonicum]
MPLPLPPPPPRGNDLLDAFLSAATEAFCSSTGLFIQIQEEAEVEDDERFDEESEEESEDESEKVKGTQGVIQIENPNLVKPKNLKARDVDIEKTSELSRHEREEIEKQRAHEMFMRLQEQGKTDQLKKDLGNTFESASELYDWKATSQLDTVKFIVAHHTNDLVHGWGVDMKLGYCAQGDRTKNVGVVDSKYVVHQSIQTLGGPSAKRVSSPEEAAKRHTVDVRSEIKRQSTIELQTFKQRWERAMKEDVKWVDPFPSTRKRKLKSKLGLDHAKKCVTEMVIWPLLRPDIFKGCRVTKKGYALIYQLLVQFRSRPSIDILSQVGWSKKLQIAAVVAVAECKGKKMGKKTKKTGKGNEKTEKKTAKAEEKRSRRESKKLSPEDDIDAILLSIQMEEAKKKEVHIEDNVPAPSPRSNCSLSVNPLKETELVLYGGGEFTSPNQERFHHYKDFWVLDLKTNQWGQLNYKGCPSPRSGHRMVLYKHKIIIFGGFYDTLREVLYKHKIIIFGGFYDTLREVRYFNDLHVFDLDQFKWQEIKPRLGCMWPSPRSGFQFVVYQDEIYLYGGYSKEVSSSDKKVSEKGIVHSDMWCLDPRTWEWNKVKKSGMPPGPRAGFSMCVHKKRVLLFGGVVDMEMEVELLLCVHSSDPSFYTGDLMMSLFLNEIYGFQLDNHRWYPLELRKEKATKDKFKKDSDGRSIDMDFERKRRLAQKQDAVSSDEDESSDNDGAEVDTEIKNISVELNRHVTITDSEESSGSSKKLAGQHSILPEIVKPCGRISSCMVVGKDTLYIYGGMMEIKDQEIALDDLYALNLSKLDEWKCIIQASESEWIEASDNEDEDKDDGQDEDCDSEDDSEESGDEDGVLEAANGAATSLQIGDAVAIIKGEGKSLRRKEKRGKIEQIRTSLGLSDSQRTPMPGESLKDFFKRTNMYWQMAACEHTQHTGKELRKDGFDLAKARYKELKPILDELAILEAEQMAEEEAPEAGGPRNKGNKKTKLSAAK